MQQQFWTADAVGRSGKTATAVDPAADQPKEQQQAFYCLDSVIGSGKTTAIIKHCGLAALAGERLIVAQPTTKLAGQTHTNFQKRWAHAPAALIHSEESENVGAEIKAATEQCEDGMVIFCTHTGLLQAPYIADRKRWHVIIDEMPQTTWASKLVLGRNRDTIRQVFDIEDRGEKYSTLTVLDDGLLGDIARDHSKHGVYSETFQEIARKMFGGWWRVQVLTAQWQRVMREGKGNGELLVFATLHPSLFSGFASVTFASANVKHTLGYLHLSAAGCEFKPHLRLANGLQYAEHPNGDLLTVHYAVEDAWSKKLRGKTVTWDRAHTVNDIIVAGALELFNGEPFAKLVNKDLLEKDPFGEAGARLPNSAHGMNNFQDLHNCVIVPALNPTPAYFTYLNDTFGLESQHVYRAVYLEQVYQASGRISIRNVKDHTPKKVVVADIIAAEFLCRMYPGSKLARLPFSEHIIYDKPKRGRPMSRTPEEKKAQDAERARQYRARKRVTQNHVVHKEICVTREPEHETSDADYVAARRARLQAGLHYGAESPHVISLFDGKKAWVASRHIAGDAKAIAAHLHDQHLREGITDKEKGGAFGVAMFDPDAAGISTWRGKGNVMLCGGTIAFDVDHSAVPAEFISAAIPCAHVIANSHNAEAADQRCHIVIFADAYMEVETYDFVAKDIARVLVDGLGIEIDRTKLNAANLMYAPHKGAHDDGWFFIDRTDLPLLDAAAAIDAAYIPPSPPGSEISEDRDQAKVERAIEYWQTHGTQKGTGHVQFYKLFRELVEAGCDAAETRSVLMQQSIWAHNQEERQGEIDALMRQF